MVKFGWLCAHEAQQPEVLVDQAVKAEESGFDMVLGADHFHPWVDDKSAAGFVWAWLGAVAMRTDLELATAVTCPIYHYHPGLIAQAAATVDRLSNGKFILGVGTGENINEGPLGFEFGGYKERIGRMREALEIMHRMFGGEKLDFDGEFFTTDKAKLYSPPVGQLPVFMAAGGPQSATFAGRRADGLITSVKNPAETIERIIDPFKESSEKHGNAGRILATRWVVFAEDREEAWEALGPMRGLRAEGRLEAVDPMVLRERADAMDRDEILDKYTIVHGVDELIGAYAELVTDVGADYVSIQVASVDQNRVLDIMKSEVLPELRKLDPTA
jgi:coenzyme F420-dependent glucose-6-phosphate dehydrogenase